MIQTPVSASSSIDCGQKRSIFFELNLASFHRHRNLGGGGGGGDGVELGACSPPLFWSVGHKRRDSNHFVHLRIEIFDQKWADSAGNFFLYAPFHIHHL